MSAETNSFEPATENASNDSITAAKRRTLRIADKPERNSVQRLIDLTTSLLKEAQTLAGDKVLADESRRLQELNLSEGIDFFDEVEQFETSLIKLALARTGGHQARAAKLLKIKPTTLNSKIKLYGIEY
ncbi:MAG TPA: helix-turn-helix domain-containing protein [Pyrinomonadaceae bacterium]|nr:helix-turn-helix domain-containing protein [Pyrinomonadaceae bacterium]